MKRINLMLICTITINSFYYSQISTKDGAYERKTKEERIVIASPY